MVQMKNVHIGEWQDDDLVGPGRYFDKLRREGKTGLFVYRVNKLFESATENDLEDVKYLFSDIVDLKYDYFKIRNGDGSKGNNKGRNPL